ncbi:MAG: glucosamine--fructose-6-phosphate aminotransferase [Syntrophorhabdus sp. PtaB.Bin006]|nr:MAG: glucosamine--fructose-6-phosphate aminotransferase [Syntrophorhabdus sp. PtaB.Bin006]
MNNGIIEKLLLSRQRLIEELEIPYPTYKGEEEGGCGVVGFCATEPVAARHIHEPSRQMHNRGNGKGGGIAALGFIPEQLGVTREILDNYYMVHVAFLDNDIQPELERKYITPCFEVKASSRMDTVTDWTAIPSLEARPPDVMRYFVRVKPEVLDSFISKNELGQMIREEAEGEFLSRQSIKLNQEYYASLGDKKAFVMSYGKNIMILKVVGYAESITDYYKIDDLKAHVWIAHQRFPTKGRVWHPGGAHPFGAMNTALVHNGDFANYSSVCEYLVQRNIYPQFLTDTEVSVQIFDLLDRTYGYPLEYIIESLAPTTELDFDRLPKEKQSIYRAIQATHIHASPDGPWFFIIARTLRTADKFQLMGITDTSMLRPQVFAFADGEVQVGLICSEKQAIDAALLSMSKDDSRICPIADKYWNARGGSSTDGGSFIFTLEKDQGKYRMNCTDKFGAPVKLPSGTEVGNLSEEIKLSGIDQDKIARDIREHFDAGSRTVFRYFVENITEWSFADVSFACETVIALVEGSNRFAEAIEVLTLLNDRRYAVGTKKRKHILQIVRTALHQLFALIPLIGETSEGEFRLIGYKTKGLLREPRVGETTLVIDTLGFPPEGNECDASLLVDAYIRGWKHFIVYNCAGQRFTGCGLGPHTEAVTIDVYDSDGDYLASGIDGLTITVHGNAQDQLGQIIKAGKLVIHGDTGQTFLYGAKGGSVFVLGNAAGRPLINSVGKPRVVINGTCLDFLAESFMAGDVFAGGGFVILNGITFDDKGSIVDLKEPYPGSNLFSLASGGAIYVRDPHKYLVWEQLNGGIFFKMSDQDWETILPYLQENERLFGITVDDLLTVDGKRKKPGEVYRKVAPAKLSANAQIESDE